MLLNVVFEMIIDLGHERIRVTSITRLPANFKCVNKAGVITSFFHLFDEINFFHVDALDWCDIFYFKVAVLRKWLMFLFDKNWDIRVGHSIDLSSLDSISDSVIDYIDWYSGQLGLHNSDTSPLTCKPFLVLCVPLHILLCRLLLVLLSDINRG